MANPKSLTVEEVRIIREPEKHPTSEVIAFRYQFLQNGTKIAQG